MTLFQAATKSLVNFACASLAGVDLGVSAELGVGAEDEVYAAVPVHLVAPLARSVPW